MPQTEFLFDELTARDVAERLRVRAEIDAFLNAVLLTTARMNGATGADRVILNNAGNGVLIIANGGDLDSPENKWQKPSASKK